MFNKTMALMHNRTESGLIEMQPQLFGTQDHDLKSVKGAQRPKSQYGSSLRNPSTSVSWAFSGKRSSQRNKFQKSSQIKIQNEGNNTNR